MVSQRDSEGYRGGAGGCISWKILFRPTICGIREETKNPPTQESLRGLPHTPHKGVALTVLTLWRFLLLKPQYKKYDIKGFCIRLQSPTTTGPNKTSLVGHPILLFASIALHTDTLLLPADLPQIALYSNSSHLVFPPNNNNEHPI